MITQGSIKAEYLSRDRRPRRSYNMASGKGYVFCDPSLFQKNIGCIDFIRHKQVFGV